MKLGQHALDPGEIAAEPAGGLAELAAQIPGLGPVAWTAPYYVRYAAALYERAAALRSACPDHAWTAQDVEQALWAASGGKAGAAATG